MLGDHWQRARPATAQCVKIPEGSLHAPGVQFRTHPNHARPVVIPAQRPRQQFTARAEVAIVRVALGVRFVDHD
jgi:hypothetical protein